ETISYILCLFFFELSIAPSGNVLLEFTATLPENAEVQEKYRDKIIAKFDLKDFLSKGYTKAINLISSTFTKKERVLHALLFAWYRHQIALKHGIANFKPVMLFRSKTIDESWSDYREFLQWSQNIQGSDFEFLNRLSGNLKADENENEQGKTRTEQALAFMREQGLETSHIADWIRQSYQAHNVIITNSQTNKTKKEKTDENTEKLLNNLEAVDNPVRAIFTVDRLTEGWDVLNLFDIVRLYEGQNGGGSNKKSGKTASATVSEKQLIGRGVRYFPFVFGDKLPNKRKFDEDLQHELRVLEELFYYTHDEQSRYISELKAELRKDGFLPENSDKVLVEIGLKPEFAQDESFKNILIWVNEKQANLNAKTNNADSLKANPQTIVFTAHGSQVVQETQFSADEKDEKSQQIGKSGSSHEQITIAKMEKHIFNKALHIKGKRANSLFHFNQLQTKLNIASRDELQTDLLKDWKIKFLGLDNNQKISPDDKLQACLNVLDKVEAHLNQSDKPFVGTTEFTSKKLWDIFSQPKQKWVNAIDIKQSVIQNHDWYVMDNFIGNNLEEQLINYIVNELKNLQANYDVKLIRNEEVLKLANFDNGDGFMPDFILLLKDKHQSTVNQTDHLLHYQIFIEPKGEHLIATDSWKQDFLNAITTQYGRNRILQKDTPHYRLIGLPFFADKEKNPKQYDKFDQLFPLS
ncbi:type III restriction endonuclease subunit R, partial [Kingella kingae]